MLTTFLVTLLYQGHGVGYLPKAVRNQIWSIINCYWQIILLMNYFFCNLIIARSFFLREFLEQRRLNSSFHCVAGSCSRCECLPCPECVHAFQNIRDTLLSMLTKYHCDVDTSTLMNYSLMFTGLKKNGDVKVWVWFMCSLIIVCCVSALKWRHEPGCGHGGQGGG